MIQITSKTWVKISEIAEVNAPRDVSVLRFDDKHRFGHYVAKAIGWSVRLHGMTRDEHIEVSELCVSGLKQHFGIQ